jgi:Na+-transporting NADH:ubiquinone oxidoreductase subunit NqrB
MTTLPDTLIGSPPCTMHRPNESARSRAAGAVAALRAFVRRFARDPRHYQMSVQAALLVYGFVALSFEIAPARAALIFATALATQAACGRLTGLPRFEWRSALITALGLCLLMRTSSAALAVVAAAISIASKFAIRVRAKHVFNPTALGLGLMMLLTHGVWVSPGQWGHAAIGGFAIGCLGSIVVTRAARADVTFGFLAAWAALLFGRAAWLGQPWVAPLHQMTNGSLLLFAFFMISDPRTTPDSPAGRLLFAGLVALGAGVVQFVLWRTNGPLWALFACAPLVPLIDRWLPGARHLWRTDASSTDSRKGDSDEAAPLPAPVVAGPCRARGLAATGA